MKSLVDDLFEYTMRQPSVINVMEFDMAQLVEQLAADFELEGRKGIKTETHPSRAYRNGWRYRKLVRVFNNLLSNALKYGKAPIRSAWSRKSGPKRS